MERDRRAGGNAIAHGRARQSGAWVAGFVPDDIIVAIDGKRVANDRFDAAVAERQPGNTVVVSYFRRDQLPRSG